MWRRALFSFRDIISQGLSSTFGSVSAPLPLDIRITSIYRQLDPYTLFCCSVFAQKCWITQVKRNDPWLWSSRDNPKTRVTINGGIEMNMWNRFIAEIEVMLTKFNTHTHTQQYTYTYMNPFFLRWQCLKKRHDHMYLYSCTTRFTKYTVRGLIDLMDWYSIRKSYRCFSNEEQKLCIGSNAVPKCT